MKAHITRTEKGEVVNQTVAEHCKNVANYAAEIMEKVGMPTVGYIAGLYHDIGKNKKFEEYLERAFNGEPVKRGSVNHTFAGVIKVLNDFHNKKSAVDLYLSEIIAFSVGAHHAMFDMGTVDKTKEAGIESRYNYYIHKDKCAEIEYESVLDYFNKEISTSEEIKVFWDNALIEFNKKYSMIAAQIKQGIYGEQFFKNVFKFFIQCLMRHTLSAVIEGDRRDTQEFMEQSLVPTTAMNWTKNLEYFNKRLDTLPVDLHINKIRRQISDILYNSEAKSDGIYQLTLPTGSGKTLSSIRYALKVAKTFNKDRIFYVAPLLSVLQQNSEVIKGYLSEKDMVLEHYSDAINDTAYVVNDTDYIDYERLRFYKATWDSPFIITTLYQLLETFFKSGLSQVRRFNKLSNSVLIIDEVQQVPLQSIQLFNLMLNYLADFCGVTVILMTATQPHFEKSSLTYPLHIRGDLTEEIEKGIDLEKEFGRRVRYDVDTRTILVGDLVNMVANLSENNKSVLLVCNIRKSCRTIYNKCKQVLAPNVKLFKLSRNMCEAEICDALREMRCLLENKEEKVVCISTQLIEAGVDISFETVIRVCAGLDNVIQTAGRCNRNNTQEKQGVVYVRNVIEDGISYLPDIVTAQVALSSTLDKFDNKLKANDTFCEAYYSIYYARQQERLKPGVTGNRWIDNAIGSPIDNNDLISSGLYKRYLILNCMKTFGERYNVYETGEQITVLIPYGDYKQNVEALRSETDAAVVAKKVRKLGRTCVTMYESALKRYIAKGIINKYTLKSQDGIKVYDLYISTVVDFEGEIERNEVKNE